MSEFALRQSNDQCCLGTRAEYRTQPARLVSMQTHAASAGGGITGCWCALVCTPHSASLESAHRRDLASASHVACCQAHYLTQRRTRHGSSPHLFLLLQPTPLPASAACCYCCCCCCFHNRNCSAATEQHCWLLLPVQARCQGSPARPSIPGPAACCEQCSMTAMQHAHPYQGSSRLASHAAPLLPAWPPKAARMRQHPVPAMTFHLTARERIDSWIFDLVSHRTGPECGRGVEGK